MKDRKKEERKKNFPLFSWLIFILYCLHLPQWNATTKYIQRWSRAMCTFGNIHEQWNTELSRPNTPMEETKRARHFYSVQILSVVIVSCNKNRIHNRNNVCMVNTISISLCFTVCQHRIEKSSSRRIKKKRRRIKQLLSYNLCNMHYTQSILDITFTEHRMRYAQAAS